MFDQLPSLFRVCFLRNRGVVAFPDFVLGNANNGEFSVRKKSFKMFA